MASSLDEPRDFCPRCGVAYEPLQEYCLECGARLPTNRGAVGVLAASWQRRFAWYPGDWIWPVALFFGLAAVATAVVLVANATRSSAAKPLTATTAVPLGLGEAAAAAPVVSTSTLPEAPQPTITTGPLPTAPGEPSTATATGTGTTATTPKPPPDPFAVWPAGQSGYTVVLESVPVAGGRANAAARARRAAKKGLRDAGVLISAEYASLHPGYYVVFAGVFATQAEATAAVAEAQAKGFQGAYQTAVTR